MRCVLRGPTSGVAGVGEEEEENARGVCTRRVLRGPPSDATRIDEEKKAPKVFVRDVVDAAHRLAWPSSTKKKSARGLCTRRALRGPPSDASRLDEQKTCPR